jgi:hypothetical protein
VCDAFERRLAASCFWRSRPASSLGTGFATSPRVDRGGWWSGCPARGVRPPRRRSPRHARTSRTDRKACRRRFYRYVRNPMYALAVPRSSSDRRHCSGNGCLSAPRSCSAQSFGRSCTGMTNHPARADVRSNSRPVSLDYRPHLKVIWRKPVATYRLVRSSFSRPRIDAELAVGKRLQVERAGRGARDDVRRLCSTSNPRGSCARSARGVAGLPSSRLRLVVAGLQEPEEAVREQADGGSRK